MSDFGKITCDYAADRSALVDTATCEAQLPPPQSVAKRTQGLLSHRGVAVPLEWLTSVDLGEEL